MVGRVEGLGAPKDRFPVLQVIRNEISGLEVKPRTDFAGNGDLTLALESAGVASHSLLFRSRIGD